MTYEPIDCPVISKLHLILPAALILIISFGACAQEVSPAETYKNCLAKTEVFPKEAFEDAIQWHSEGGKEPATHCAAAALIALGIYVEAANRLEGIAKSVQKGPKFKARVLNQAVLAWLSAGDPLRAEAVATTALSLEQKEPAILIGRARARAELGDYQGAKVDLDVALTLIPNHSTALAYRATAFRYLDNKAAALADANAALAANPDHPEALLERGIIRRLQNDKLGARADWLKLLNVAPDTGAADIARLNLEKMDLTRQ